MNAPTKNTTKAEDTTRSPLRTVQILHVLAVNPAGISLADLSTRLELPKTSLFRLLKSLEAGDYIRADNGLYVIGPATLKLGSAIVQNRAFPNCALPVMQAISDRCGETIILGTLADNQCEVVYAEVIDATKPLRFISKAGSTNPLYGSASGQILLAAMPETQLNNYLDTVPRLQHAPGTLTSRDALLQKLKQIRDEGLSESLEGLVEGVFSVAAPVFDAQGRTMAGLSISAPSARGLKFRHTLCQLALEGGKEISRTLGYNGRYPVPAS